MVTKTEVSPSRVGSKEGFNFSVYYDNKEYPNMVSGLYKTELGAKRKLTKYLNTGEFSFYGNAE